MNRALIPGTAVLCALSVTGLARHEWVAKPAPPPEVWRAIRCGPVGSMDLTSLCAASDTVIVARVTRAAGRQTTSPVDSCADVHTVYEVAVEEYVRDKGAPQRPPTLKVHADGGMDESGIVHVWDDEPGLNVGDRYILFLESNKDGDQFETRAGVSRIYRCADEYRLASQHNGHYILKNGLTNPASDPYQGPVPWAIDGPTILGRSEADAIAQIRKGIRAAAIEEAKTLAAGAIE